MGVLKTPTATEEIRPPTGQCCIFSLHGCCHFLMVLFGWWWVSVSKLIFLYRLGLLKMWDEIMFLPRCKLLNTISMRIDGLHVLGNRQPQWLCKKESNLEDDVYVLMKSPCFKNTSSCTTSYVYVALEWIVLVRSDVVTLCGWLAVKAPGAYLLLFDIVLKIHLELACLDSKLISR